MWRRLRSARRGSQRPQHPWCRSRENVQKGRGAPDHHKGIPQTPARVQRLRNRGRRLFPESTDLTERMGDGAFQTCAGFDPSILNLRVFRNRAQKDDRLQPAACNLERQANRRYKTGHPRIMVVGWKETNNRVAGKAGNALQTADDRGRRTLVRRLGNHPRWIDVGQFPCVKPLMGPHDRKQGPVRGYSRSKSGARLREKRPPSVQSAKLLRTVFARNHPGERLQSGPITARQDDRPCLLIIHVFPFRSG